MRLVSAGTILPVMYSPDNLTPAGTCNELGSHLNPLAVMCYGSVIHLSV